MDFASAASSNNTVMTENTTSYRGRVKYTDKQSRKYQVRKPHKHQAEMRLIDRAFAFVPKHHRVLDAPCGGGRVMLHLARKGYQADGADLSESMLAIAREKASEEHLPCTVERQDLERLSYTNGQFDTIVCFRYFTTSQILRFGSESSVNFAAWPPPPWCCRTSVRTRCNRSVVNSAAGTKTVSRRRWPRWKAISATLVFVW